jgi:8-oxo-dGTP pyrophosphatase MutT (NUDIX family)
VTPNLSLEGRDVVVAGLLVSGRRVLLGHRDPGRSYYPDCWDVPGGHVEAGEEPAAALRRELAEELGVDVDEPRRPPDAALLGPEVDFRLWVVPRWRGEAANRAPEEHDEVGWRTLAEAVSLRLAHPGLRRILAAALGVEYWAAAVAHDAAGRVLLRAAGSDVAPGPGPGPGGPLPSWEVAPGSADAGTVRHGLQRAAGITVHVPGETPVALVEAPGRALAVWDVPWPEPEPAAAAERAPGAAVERAPSLVWHEPGAARTRLAAAPALLAAVDRVLGWGEAGRR